MRRGAGIAALVLLNAAAVGAYIWAGTVRHPILTLRNATDQEVVVRHDQGVADMYRRDGKMILQPGEFATIEFIKGDTFHVGLLGDSFDSVPGSEAELVGDKTADYEIFENPDGSLRFVSGIRAPGADG